MNQEEGRAGNIPEGPGGGGTLWHAQSPEDVLKSLAVSDRGLTSQEAAERRAKYGANILPAPAGHGPLRIFLAQINNPISWVLVAAGILAFLLGKQTDSLVVFGAVFINAIIGFLQEHRAGREIAALAAMVAENAAVLRDGKAVSLPVSELVPGDIVMLASGDKVPADLRLLKVKNLHIEEAALTGESVPSAKHTAVTEPEAALGERACMAYGGTMVTQGTASGLVVATGVRTELGRINQLLRQTSQLETPLTRQLAVVSRYITMAVMVLAAVLFAYGLWFKNAKLGEAAMTAITLAVAAIPEGLPAIITIALAVGVRRMAARRAVVRHLPAVETLGSTSVICSDKTGTLTRNEMTVHVLWCGGREYRLSGVGYHPAGTLTHDGAEVTGLPADLRELLLAGALCNDSTLTLKDEVWTISGDPTEAALIVAGRKLGLDEGACRAAHSRVDVIPFESEHKYMATLNRGNGVEMVFLKGAPEAVIARCGLDGDAALRVQEAQNTMARQGMRVLALAGRKPDAGMTQISTGWAGSGFFFLGLMGMIDPPRQEAIDAIALCHRAGIAVKMITGDHHVTAAAIGRDLGIVKEHGEALSGAELDKLDEAGFRAAAQRCNVFARVAPEHKIRLVEALQSQGHVVAMTGDGVNDAPALKRADIGVAMGITGTAVSQAAAKIVLTDDNFATIASAVEEGRRVYDNLIKSLAFVLPTNLGLGMILAAGMFFFPTVEVEILGHELLQPMSPTQILWINLVASVTLTIPLAFEQLGRNAMSLPPRRKGEPVFSAFILTRTLLTALFMAAGTCLLFLWEYQRRVGGSVGGLIPHDLHLHALADAQTMAVTTIILFQVFYLLHCRSLKDSLFATGWFSNPVIWFSIGVLLLLQSVFTYLPFMHRLFSTMPLDGAALLRSTLVAATILPAITLEKWLWRRKQR
jgi:magnesium-transporting ATPase (P-type)